MPTTEDVASEDALAASADGVHPQSGAADPNDARSPLPNAPPVPRVPIGVPGTETDPFTKAVMFDTDLLEQMLDAGLDPETVNDQQANRDRLLYYAARIGATDAARLLLARGADPNGRSWGTGKTALHQAAYSGHLDMVRLLLEHGTDPALVDDFEANALREATGGRHARIVWLLLAAGADPDQVMDGGDSMRDLAEQYGDEAVRAVDAAFDDR